MKLLSTALLTAALFTASTLCAELKYISYDLANPAADPIAVPVANIKAAEYHTGSTMLFVQDTDISEEYYIGAFEVTVAQARTLGWTTTETSGAAYAVNATGDSYQFAAAHPFPEGVTRLSFPSVAQWQAYAGNPARPCNVFQGRGTLTTAAALTLSDWYANYAGSVEPNDHGLFNSFGNAAEYTTDAHEFYGGYADSSCVFSSLSAETKATAAAISKLTTVNSALLGARLIYTPPAFQRYTVTVTLNGTEMSQGTYAPGDAVTVSAPAMPKGHRAKSLTITPASITETAFTMPSGNVTFNYTSAPYLLLDVTGGTVTKREVFEGDTVTFTPAPGTYEVFSAWTLPTGTATDTETLEVTFGAEAFSRYAAGSTLTYTATFKSYPRVLVYSGSAVFGQGTGSAIDAAEGYYTPGTRLTLSAGKVPPGYAVSGWEKDGESFSGDTHTVGDYGSIVSFSPVYRIDPDSPIENTTVTRIGETEPAAGTYTARTTLGYVAGETLTRTAAGNSFIWYTTVPADKAYAVLDTLTKALVYADAPPSDSRTTAPTLKRIALENEQPYYVGIYETTIAHTLAVKEAAGKTLTATEKANRDNTMPQVDKNGTTQYAAYLADLEAVFGTAFTLPTVAQIKGITWAGLGTDENGKQETYVGTGCRDPKITDDMIFCGAQNASKYQESGLTVCDPYGFYDLWGNVAEMIAEGETNGLPYGSLRGGHCGNPRALCHLDVKDPDTFPNDQCAIPGAFRPAATVPAKLTVTIEGIDEPFDVLPGQLIRLAPQVRAGATFTGWTATAGGVEQVLEATAEGLYEYTVESDVTLSPGFSTEAPSVQLTCINCKGPERVLPGSETRIYADIPGRTLLSVTVEPAAAGTFNAETGTVTFSAGANGAVTVTATYETPAAPGYRFSLR